jgi:hypothetical protein
MVIAGARYSTGSDALLATLSPYATWLYVSAAIVAAISLRRAGVELHRLGFGAPLRVFHAGLALAAIVLLQTFGFLNRLVLRHRQPGVLRTRCRISAICR